jgi:PleD family two-component response regulator
MPEINGFELIPIIRSLEEHKDTPIIFLSSEGTKDNVAAAIGFGVNDFIGRNVMIKVNCFEVRFI